MAVRLNEMGGFSRTNGYEDIGQPTRTLIFVHMGAMLSGLSQKTLSPVGGGSMGGSPSTYRYCWSHDDRRG
jgi:hypothetical protein